MVKNKKKKYLDELYYNMSSIADLPITTSEDVEKDKEWLKNWYAQRILVMDDIDDEYKELPYLVERGLNTPFVMQTFEDHTGGQYHPRTRQKGSYIQITPNYDPKRHIATHEFNHAIQYGGGDESHTRLYTPNSLSINPLYEQFYDSMNELKPVHILGDYSQKYGGFEHPKSIEELYNENQIQRLKEEHSGFSYYDRLDEQHSRLMQLRQANGLDPTKRDYTIEDIQKMRNDKNFKDFNIFKRYNDDYILNMLNNWVYNPNDTRSKARLGKLVLLKDKDFITDNTKVSNRFIDNQTKAKTLQLHNAVQKAVEDKQKYAKYNIATVEYDDKGEKYNMNLPAVKITAKAPDYLNYVTEYDIARANQYYGKDLNRRTMFLKDIGTYNKTGKSQFMQDVNRLAVLPNLAMIGAGLGSGAILNPAFGNLASASFVANELSDKNYKNAAIEAALGFGPLAMLKGAQLLGKTNLARSVVTSAMLRNGIRNATKHKGIDVTEKYFISPDEWYRVIDKPEIGTIKELGMNVTSTDALRIPSMSNNFRIRRINEHNSKKHGTTINILRKQGSAHGNTSQAAARKLWTGTITGNHDLFKHGVLEGKLPEYVYHAPYSRSPDVLTHRDNLGTMERIGFHTGEMPIENLKYFEQLPNKKFRYMGEVLPNKIEYVIGESNPFYLNSDYTNNLKNIVYSTNITNPSVNVSSIVNTPQITPSVLNDLNTMSFPRYAELRTNTPYSKIPDIKKIQLKDAFNKSINNTKRAIMPNSHFDEGVGGYYDYKTKTVVLPQYSIDPAHHPNNSEYHEYLHALYDNDKFLKSLMIGNLNFESSLGKGGFTNNYKLSGIRNSLLAKEELANTASQIKRAVLKYPERYVSDKNLIKKYKNDPNNIEYQNELINNVNDDVFEALLYDINGYGQNFLQQAYTNLKSNKITDSDIDTYIKNIKKASTILPFIGGATVINSNK